MSRRAVPRSKCRLNFILSQGWAFNPDLVFVDDGYSGGDVERPALTRLRKMVQDGQIHAVVVYKLDRLSRRRTTRSGIIRGGVVGGKDQEGSWTPSPTT
jgi:DNA invertase Pin-like site-specific DNA recombinase